MADVPQLYGGSRMGTQLFLISPNPFNLSIAAAYLGKQVTFTFLLRRLRDFQKSYVVSKLLCAFNHHTSFKHFY